MNVVILTIGRSGSTVIARMLRALGWQLPGADQAYAEHVEFRRLNDLILSGRPPEPQVLRALVSELSEPWVLKDPRLSSTFEAWRPYLDTGGNLLLWLRRDLSAVEKSLRRQGWLQPSKRGFLLRGRTLPESEKECARYFARWEGPKVKIAYEDVHRAIGMFDRTRGQHVPRDHERDRESQSRREADDRQEK